MVCVAKFRQRARITAKDEFNKKFKESQQEINILVAEAKGIHGEIFDYHKAILETKKQPDIGRIKNRNKDGKGNETTNTT